MPSSHQSERRMDTIRKNHATHAFFKQQGPCSYASLTAKGMRGTALESVLGTVVIGKGNCG